MHLRALPRTDDQHRSAVALSVLGRGIATPAESWRVRPARSWKVPWRAMICHAKCRCNCQTPSAEVTTRLPTVGRPSGSFRVELLAARPAPDDPAAAVRKPRNLVEFSETLQLGYPRLHHGDQAA